MLYDHVTLNQCVSLVLVKARLGDYESGVQHFTRKRGQRRSDEGWKVETKTDPTVMIYSRIMLFMQLKAMFTGHYYVTNPIFFYILETKRCVTTFSNLESGPR